jgi:hypothetical protein
MSGEDNAKAFTPRRASRSPSPLATPRKEKDGKEDVVHSIFPHILFLFASLSPWPRVTYDAKSLAPQGFS